MVLLICPQVFGISILEEGKISSEDDAIQSDGDFNDVVMTWSGQVTYTSGVISKFQANMKGARCGAKFQDAIYFKSKFCDGTLLVAAPDGSEVHNGHVLKTQWTQVSSAFCRDFFIGGEIGKYQEDYNNGLEYQVTLLCDPGQSITPEVTQSSGVNFNSLPMTEFWGISPDGDPLNILDSSSTIYYTMGPSGKLETLKNTLMHNAYAQNQVFGFPSIIHQATDAPDMGEKNSLTSAYKLNEQSEILNNCVELGNVENCKDSITQFMRHTVKTKKVDLLSTGKVRFPPIFNGEFAGSYMPTKVSLCTGVECNRFNLNSGKLHNIRKAIDMGDGKFRYQDDLFGNLPTGGSCSETPVTCSGDSILSSTQALGGELFQCCPAHMPELVLGDSGSCQCVSPDGNVDPNLGGGGGVNTPNPGSPLPDLGISNNLNIIPQNSTVAQGPLESESVDVEVTIINNSTVLTSNVNVKLYVQSKDSDAPRLSYSKTLNTPFNNQNPQTTNFNIPSGLKYQDKIIVYADEGKPNGLIPELNEKDNRQVFRPIVRVPDLAITLNPPTEFDISRAADTGHTLFSGDGGVFYNDSTDTVDLTIDIENKGLADASNVEACFKITSPPTTSSSSGSSSGGVISGGSGSSFTGGSSGTTSGLPQSTITYKCQTINNLYANTGAPTRVTDTISFNSTGEWRVDFLIDRNKNITETRTDNNQTYRLIKVINKPTLNITSTSIFKHLSENPYLKVGETADVSVIGINNSNSTLSNTVNLSFDHTPPGGSVATTSLTTGASLSPTQSYKSTGQLTSLTQGLHQIESIIDYGSSNSQTQTQNFCVHPLLPDLAASYTKINCPNSPNHLPTAGQNISLKVHYSNLGDTALNSQNAHHRVKLFYTTDKDWRANNTTLTLIGQRDVATYTGSGESRTEVFTWNTSGLAAGDYFLVADVDSLTSANTNCPSSGGGWDANPENNKLTSKIKLYGAGKDLTLSDFTFSDPNPVEDTQVTISVDAKNLGSSSANSQIVWQVFDGSGSLYSQHSESLSLLASACHSEASVTKTHTFTPNKESAYLVKAFIDHGNSIAEFNENNNDKQKYLYVSEEPFLASLTGTTGSFTSNTSGSRHHSTNGTDNINAWVQASSHQNCNGGCWPWEWGAASSATFAKGKKFTVSGPNGNRTAYANITVPIEFSGYFDNNAAPLGGSDYRLKIGLVLAEGSTITSSLVHGYGGLRHVVLLNEKKEPFWDLSNAGVVKQVNTSGIEVISSSGATSSAISEVSAYKKIASKVGKALNFADLIIQAVELSNVDDIFADSQTITIKNVALEPNTDYIVFLYAKMTASATGVTSVAQLNFGVKHCGDPNHTTESTCTSNGKTWNSSASAPQMSIFAQEQLPERGLWIFDPVVEFR
jgi:hypothetical protein